MKLNLACLVTFLLGATAVEELDEVSDKMAERMPERGSLKNIEASLLGMAAKLMKQDPGTNATGTQLDFIHTISDLINNTMKPNMQGRVTEAENVLDAAWNGYGVCTHPDDPGHLRPLDAPLNAHAACRQTQHQLYVTFHERCILGTHVAEEEHEVICTRYDGMNVFPNPTPCVMDPGTPVPMIGHYLIDMADTFRQLFAEIRSTKWRCLNISDPCEDYHCGTSRCTYEDQRIECDGLQGVFEEEACEVYKNYTCEKYNTCFEASRITYDEALAAAQSTEAGVRIEWRAIQRIECLIRALLRPSDEIHAAIDACAAATYTGDEIVLNYPGGTLPVIRECTNETMASLRPMATQFTTRWYGNAPVHGAAAPCASSCCGGYVGPSYPTGVVCPYIHANGSFCRGLGYGTEGGGGTTTPTGLGSTGLGSTGLGSTGPPGSVDSTATQLFGR